MAALVHLYAGQSPQSPQSLFELHPMPAHIEGKNIPLGITGEAFKKASFEVY